MRPGDHGLKVFQDKGSQCLIWSTDDGKATSSPWSNQEEVLMNATRVQVMAEKSKFDVVQEPEKVQPKPLLEYS